MTAAVRDKTLIYLQFDQMAAVNTKNVTLEQVASIWCQDKDISARLKAMPILTLSGEQEQHVCMSALQIVAQIGKEFPYTQVVILGENDFIISYHIPKKSDKPLQYGKTALVCLIIFFGSAFSVATFNNDVDVIKLFQELQQTLTGTGDSGLNLLELSYSVGITVGILVFYNHFFKRKVTNDPTPLEVEMRLYEQEANSAVILDSNRREENTDHE